MALHTASLSTTQRWCRWLGVGLLVACIAHATTGGWALADGHAGKGLLYAAIMALITAAAACLLPIADGLSRNGMRLRALAVIGGWVLLLAAEGLGNLMALGHTRQQSIAIATVADRQSNDRRRSIGDAERTLALIEASIAERSKSAGWLSTKPAAAWRADVGNLEGHALYARSKQCANVTLPDSRAHCDRLNEARANLAVAVAHEADADRLASSQAALTKMRAEARTDAPGISASRTQSDNLVRVSGLIRGEWISDASTDARAQANFAVELMMLVVMMLGPSLLLYAAHIDWSSRTPRRSIASRIVGSITAWRRWRSGEPIETILPQRKPEPAPEAAPVRQAIAPAPAPYLAVRRLADLLPANANTRAA